MFFSCSFTKYCKDLCEELNVGGWIKNTKRGTITGKIQGPKSRVEQIVYWLSNKGSPESHIERCDLNNWQMLAKLDYTSFTIRF
ncbi:acylphosphatase-2 isoform X3 [Dendroctonus ponderosae]|uniref:acylphosphatase-2 isoform X3 n=1 Tax=Dendroctonus ponderosae TaxID=77166 RepID=UPI0020362211|nr:acylphosphatase-2 isoform X3 [Dendroctonus ponderosae]